MHIITTRSLIKTVAERWDKMYENKSTSKLFWRLPNQVTPADILKQLQELNTDTCTKKDVDNIIGNDTWTRLECGECGLDVAFVITVGDKLDYNSNTAQLCTDCIVRIASIVVSHGN